MRNRLPIELPILFFFIFFFWSSVCFAQAPTITTFSPANAASGETVTINGTNFSSITAVTFGGIPASSYTVVSATMITAVVGSGNSGSVRVTKTGFSPYSKTGFTFSAIPTVTQVITDFGGFWSTTTTTNSSIPPNDAHNMLAFTYGGITYATGVNNTALSGNGVAYAPTNFRALPAILNGTTSGSSLFIVAASKMDGNTAAGLYTHPAIKDLTIQSVLTDGLNGLNLGTGYTNLPVGATTEFTINSIQVAKAADNEPDLVITQIADPSSSAFDTYRFLDASNNIVGNQLQIDLSKLSALGDYYLDLFTVNNGIPFSTAKPKGVNSSNTTRDIRLMAFKLSDFGITPANYSQVKKLQIIPSGVTDMAFVAYNTAAINLPPSIAQNIPATSSAICDPGGGNAHLAVSASAAGGGALTYFWEVSTDGGTTWNTVTNGGIYSGATTNELSISSATINYQYRATVTEAGSEYSATSAVFTITAIASTPLSGTLNPTGFNNCLNAVSGTTSLSVAPTGGTGSYSYQWSFSTLPGGTYTNITDAIYSSYSPPLNVTGTMFYKVFITSGCVNRLSNAAQVIISGANISSVTNGTSCSPGTVALSATASGGTINWYAALSGGASLGTGSGFTTPSIASTTTYYAGTTLSGCSSTRVPVVATIINTITLSNLNFNVDYASNVCSGSGSDVSIASSALIDGTYQINYNISGSNTITGASVIVNFAGGRGSFTTVPLITPGANTVTITGVQVNGCIIAPLSGNTRGFTVNAASPAAGDFNVTVANGCSNDAIIASVTSTTLATGTYIVTYNISGSNTLSAVTSQMIFTAGSPGTGNFSLPLLGNAGSNVVTVSKIALLSSPDCSSTLNYAAPAFTNNPAAVVNAGTPKIMCASDPSVNIAAGASANNYTALVWSTSNGTGFFSGNSTANALTSTTYVPDASDISRGSVLLTLTGTSSSGCAAVSNTYTLTINPGISGGTVSNDQTIPIGTQPGDLTLSGNTGTVTKWQRSYYPDFALPTDILNTSNTLPGAAIGNVNVTSYVRAICQGGTCSPVASAFAIISVTGSLPVKLIYFNQKCEGDSISLQWATAMETGTRKFTIEKSADGNLWRTIKDIPAAGNSNVTKTYNHKIPTNGNNHHFYRLKQTDFDGTIHYSGIINVNCSAVQSLFSISPNPGKDKFILSNLPLKGQLRVTDMQGREVISPRFYDGATYSISLGRFASGLYIVTVYANGAITTKRLIKE